MLIPSIDLMGGKVVQLVQGSKKALEFDNFQEWVDRFSKYPMVQVIDLDAAMGRGNNADLVRQIAGQLYCQVGGGIRTLEAAQATLALGSQRVIVGSSLISQGAINVDFDGLHPTPAGYTKIAETFFTSIKHALEQSSSSSLTSPFRFVPFRPPARRR